MTSATKDMNNFCRKFVAFFINSIFIKRGLLLLAILFTLLHFLFFLPKTLQRTDPWRDVIAYYLVKERVQEGLPVYAGLPENGLHDRSKPLYLYPPFLASALATLPPISFVTFARIWTLVLYGAFWIYAIFLGKIALGKISLSGTLVAGLFLSEL